MRTLLAVLLLLPQEDAAIRDLIRNLDSDSLDVRSSAEAALAKMGKAAVPLLEDALKGASAEARGRIERILRTIADREKRASAVPAGTRVTLRAVDRPVLEVLEELQRRSGTPLELGKVPSDLKVTVSLENVCFWDALDEVCRATGQMVFQPKDLAVALAKKRYAARPRFVSGPFAVLLQEINSTISGTFGRAGDRRTKIQFVLCWEKGGRPDRIGARPIEIRDDRGTDLLDPKIPGLQPYFASVEEDRLSQGQHLYLGNVPAEEATKLARLKFELSCEFTLKYAEVMIEKPEGKSRTDLSCDKFSLTFQSCKRLGDVVRADFLFATTEGKPWLQPVRGRAKDKEGKEYAGGVQTNVPVGNASLIYMDFKVPGSTELAELRISVPAEVHTERIVVDLKDVPLR